MNFKKLIIADIESGENTTLPDETACLILIQFLKLFQNPDNSGDFWIENASRFGVPVSPLLSGILYISFFQFF